MIRACLIGALRDQRGTMLIETALIAPALAALALGSYEISMMVTREQQLQSAANEATEIVLAAANGPTVTSADIEPILESTLNLAPDQLTLTPLYRCGASDTTSSTQPTCATGEQMYSYAKLTITDTYEPLWTSFGIGHDVDFHIERTVQIS
jgi:Flp pilus assembly protein TadG